MTLDLAALDRIEALRQKAGNWPPYYDTHARTLTASHETAAYLAALSPDVVGELVKWARKGMTHMDAQQWRDSLYGVNTKPEAQR